MPRYSCNPARLIDRPWRSGHPFRPHPGLLRRIVMGILLVVLSLVIGGYIYITDSNHVRRMAQSYLSKLVGGRVEIRNATLSIFEGLRLEGIEVHVDPQPGRPDSLLFSADNLVLNYDPAHLIRGQLESTQIIAQKPHVYLTLTQQQKEDRWNYTRLSMEPREPTSAAPVRHGPVIALPEVVLRNAVIDISELKAGQVVKHGSMYIDGQLSPTDDGYSFELQTRGISEELGPYATGTISRSTGAVTASLRNVQFDEDLRSMFPTPELRDWWERHELSGNVRVEMTYTPGHGRTPPDFRIQTVFDDVTLAVHREEWSSREDVLRWQRLQEAVGLERSAYRLAGFSVARPGVRQAVGGATPPVEALASAAETAPLWVRHVSGNFTFTPHGIEVETTGAVAITPQRANTFHIHGRMDGYDPDAPFHLEIRSADPEGLEFTAAPRFVESFPKDVRQFYEDLRPEGRCRIVAQVSRPVAGAVPQVTGEVEVMDAKFVFHQFPYPFRGANGRIAFGRDESGKDYVRVINMRGRGMLGGPNENAEVAISGRVGPIGPDSPEPGFDLHATGTNICSEPRFMQAMPPEVHKALAIFDAPGRGEFPQFKGNFACNIHRDPGHDKRWTFDTDIDLLDAAGKLVPFPYPLKSVHGLVKVRDGYVDVLNVMMNVNGGAAKVNGRVRWADENGHDVPLDMTLTIGTRGLPIDKDLIGAMPPEQGDWVRRLGLAGKLDAYGRIFTLPPTPHDYDELAKYHHRDAQIGYDLNLTARDGTLWPADGLFSVSALAGKMHLTRDRLEILDLHGRREDADLQAGGFFTFTGPAPRLSVHVNAKNLAMDRPLYAMLPADGRKSWDEVQPRGVVDAEVEYNGPLGPAPEPQGVAPNPKDGFTAVLHPRKLSVRVRTAPYALTFDHGSISIGCGKTVLKDLIGSHGSGRIYVSGTGSLAGAPLWTLDLRAENLPCDAELRKALPATLISVVDGLKLRGNLGFHFPKLTYRGSESDADPDIEMGGTVSLRNGSIDVGVPLANVYGGMEFQTSSRQGKLDILSGSLKFDSLTLGGRPLRDLKLKLVKPTGKNELHIDKIEAKIAGGELAGGVTLFFPDDGPNRYTMGITIRNADVKDLTGETDEDIRGELTASLSLEGAWGEASQRRGRGDVVVAGKQLYRIPLMLGLLQVTNLSLPIGGPFTKGTARYNVEGTRVNFEQVDLRADAMTMSGNGYLDFGTKQVRMNLSTDNPGGFKIPFIHDLWQGARQELLKITVRGTVQDPKVEPTSMGTFTTTIDEVFRGEGRK